MINIEDYQYLGLVTKVDVDTGTNVVQCVEDIFDGDEKLEFKAMCQFDPERNEMFFADKLILCEGDTEKYSLPIIFDKFGFNIIDKKISIIECGGKNGIPLFQKILNKFNEQAHLFEYVVFYDLDIPAQRSRDAAHKQELESKAIVENSIINELLGDNKKYIFKSDFENHMSLSLGNKGKPYKAYKALLNQDRSEWPNHLKDFIADNF